MQENDFPASENTHQLVNAQIRLETEPIFRQVEKLCAFLGERNELYSTENSVTTGSRREGTSPSSVDNRSHRTKPTNPRQQFYLRKIILLSVMTSFILRTLIFSIFFSKTTGLSKTY